MPARRRRFPSHASDRHRPWSVSSGVRPAVTLAYSAIHDDGGCAAKPAPPPPPPPPTPLPGAAPLVTPPHGGPPGPGRRRRACPRTGTTAPPDGEDFAPHPAALIIGHVVDRCGSVRQEQRGGEEEEEPRRVAGEAAGAAVVRGGGGVAMRPSPASSSRCGDSCGGARELHRKRWTMNKRQSKLTKDGVLRGGLNFVPLPPPQKKTQSAIGIGGRGWWHSIWRRKEGLGMQLS